MEGTETKKTRSGRVIRTGNLLVLFKALVSLSLFFLKCNNIAETDERIMDWKEVRLNA